MVSKEFHTNSIFLNDINGLLLEIKLMNNSQLGKKGGGIYFQNCGYITIMNSSFEFLKSRKGGAIYIEGKKRNQKQFQVIKIYNLV